jgi:hypothetical protein
MKAGLESSNYYRTYKVGYLYMKKRAGQLHNSNLFGVACCDTDHYNTNCCIAKGTDGLKQEIMIKS